MQSEKLCILTVGKSTLLTQRSELIIYLMLEQQHILWNQSKAGLLHYITFVIWNLTFRLLIPVLLQLVDCLVHIKLE